VENSTPPEVCISQAQLSSIALSCRDQAGSPRDYEAGFLAEYQADFRVGSDKSFKYQQALQWTL